jgi:8-oxo-dGTP pyrophosphatase MutT (NUDIX family)
MTASHLQSRPEDTECIAADPAAPRTVVAVVVEWRGRIGLFRRSQSVHHDRGRWHCITGYVDPHNSPAQQALEELFEETGLRAIDIDNLTGGPSLHLDDHQGNRWVVHTFRAVTERRRLTINWEHDSYRWVTPSALTRFSNRVSWLDEVVLASSAADADGVMAGPAAGGGHVARSPKALPAAS